MTFKRFVIHLAKEEGLKEQVNIAQLNEVTRIILSCLASMSYVEIAQLLKNYQFKPKK